LLGIGNKGLRVFGNLYKFLVAFDNPVIIVINSTNPSVGNGEELLSNVVYGPLGSVPQMSPRQDFYRLTTGEEMKVG
jgi:hypothetical protein